MKKKVLSLFNLFFFSILALCAFKLMAKEPVEKLPLESRYVEWIDLKTYRMPLDTKPHWRYDVRYQGEKKPQLFITETPDFYYPRATFNAQHFSYEKAPMKLRRDFEVFSRSAIKAIAKNYGHNGRHIKGITFVKKGQLRGYEATVEGKVDGDKKDVIIYFAAAPDDSVFSFVVFTQPGKADHIRNTFDRMAINVEFPGGTLGKF